MHEELVQALSACVIELSRLRDVHLPHYDGKIGEPEIKPIHEAIALIKQDQETIYIDGYYINKGKKEGTGFENFKCIIGAWDGDENDNNIFYYFDNEEDLQSMMETENRTDTEFVVTKVERG